jgi:hypothetical protein
MTSNCDQWIETLKTCKPLPIEDLKQLCEIVRDILIRESNVAEISTPVTVCGDVHGQFYDVLELLELEVKSQTPTIFLWEIL